MDKHNIILKGGVNINENQAVTSKLRRLILGGMIVYTALVLYFMFFGFNRIEKKIDYNQYTFMFVPEGIPLRFPELTMSWLYDFGNIAAFIPFGIIIPMLYRVRFRKFIVLFILVISSLEVLQSLTFLGTFDIMDIISNTLGAFIGFVAYKVGFTPEITLKKLIASAVSVLMLIIVIMVVSEGANYGIHVNERVGPVEVLNEINEDTPIKKDFLTFIVQGEAVQPKFNLLTSGDGTIKEYSFHLGKKDLWLYADCGIPDEEAYKGSVTIFIDGEEFFQFSEEDEESRMLKMKIFLDRKIEDVKIVVTGNAKVWGVSYAEIKHWWE